MKRYPHLAIAALAHWPTKMVMELTGRKGQSGSIAVYTRSILKASTWMKVYRGSTEYQNRPAFMQMFNKLAENGTNLVLVSNQDRLSRQLLIQELIIRDFNELGISIISVANGDLTNTDDEHANMVRQVIGSLIQMERHKLTRRLRIAREKVRNEKGKCEGRKPLQESNPDLLKAVLRLHRKSPKAPRRTYKQISQILNDEGFTTSKGTPITPNYVCVIIHKHKKGLYRA